MSVAVPAERAEEHANGWAIFGMTVGHLVNDSYSNFVPTLMPLLAEQLGFPLVLAGLASTTYMLTSSFIQPYFGHFADRRNMPMVAVTGVLLSGLGASLLGIAPAYVFVVLLAGLCGVGMSAYHPQAAASVYAAAGRRKTTFMSIYMFGGNLGLSLSPLMSAITVDRWGLRSTPALLVLGLVGAYLVFVTSQKYPGVAKAEAREDRPRFWEEMIRRRRTLLPILSVIVTRAVAYSVIVALLPFYLSERGLSASQGGGVISAMFLSGAIAGITIGYLCDRIGGQANALAVLLILAGVGTVLITQLHGLLLWPAVVLLGATLMGSFPILTTTAQQLMPGNIGLISGFVLGWSLGLGGIAVTPISLLADRTSIAAVLAGLAILPVISGVLALQLKPERFQTG